MATLYSLGVFFGGVGILLVGAGFMWWISLQDREMKRKAGEN